MIRFAAAALAAFLAGCNVPAAPDEALSMCIAAGGRSTWRATISESKFDCEFPPQEKAAKKIIQGFPNKSNRSI